jgi:hypothetical protein
MGAGGRPTKYTKELVSAIDEFFNEAVPTNMRIPTVEGLCLKIGISRNTAYRWAKENEEFSDTLELIKVKQKEYLTEIGIFGGKEINATIVSLLLKVNRICPMTGYPRARKFGSGCIVSPVPSCAFSGSV